jgi:hypothetical protein
LTEAAFGHAGGYESTESDQRADRQVDARRQDDEGHADSEEPVDRHLPHDIEKIEWS